MTCQNKPSRCTPSLSDSVKNTCLPHSGREGGGASEVSRALEGEKTRLEEFAGVRIGGGGRFESAGGEGGHVSTGWVKALLCKERSAGWRGGRVSHLVGGGRRVGQGRGVPL